MKVEKFLKGLFTFVCVMMLASSITSCEKEEDPGTYYYYSASGEISSTSSDMNESLSSLFAIPEYNEAIVKKLGQNFILGEHDSEVIDACDEVYKKHKREHSSWQGHVEIHRSKVDTEGNTFDTKVLKTYNYGK